MATKAGKNIAVALPLYDRVREILDAARANVARTVNTTQVVVNWMVGREIVEAEQAGRRRADYGAELLQELAARLNADFGSGYGVDNLELFRRFYLEYPGLLPQTISDAPRRKSAQPENSEAVRRNSAAASGRVETGTGADRQSANLSAGTRQGLRLRLAPRAHYAGRRPFLHRPGLLPHHPEMLRADRSQGWKADARRSRANSVLCELLRPGTAH